MAIRTVAVIGAGDQGRAFALRCAEAGFPTVLEDVMPARLRRAREELAARDAAAVESRLQFALTVEEAVREADVAIDFVPDELESKLEIFSMVDRMAPPKTILCTPTAAVSISDLAACTYRSDRCIALQSADGGLPMGIVAVVRGRDTSAETAGDVQAWLAALGYAVHAIQEEQEQGSAASWR